MSSIDPLGKDEFIQCMSKSEDVGDYSRSAVKRFYDWMYKRKDGMVQVCAFPVPTEDKSKEDMGEGKWLHARTFNEFEDFCRTHSGLWRYHVYAGVNTLDSAPEYGRGTVEEIDSVHRLSFDIELSKDSYGGSTKEEVWWCYRYALAEVKFMLEEYGVLPLVVMSENGIHLHYRVDFPNYEDLLDGRQHMYSKYITHQAINSNYVSKIRQAAPSGISFDQDDVSDPPRVMKVPGTKGIKSENGRLCGIIHEPNLSDAGVIKADELDVDQEDIDELKDTERSSSSGDTPRNVDTDPSSLSVETMEKVKRLAKNDDSFARYWKGDLDEKDSRSEAEFSFIIKMLNHDFSEEQIIEVMWGSGMSKWEEESDHYRERTIEKAFEWFDGTVVRDSKDGTFTF